ncbi:MAG: tetratricopeptide repeat protein, partial [bacterium]
MEKSRLETLQEFVAANPGDSFVRYGLAQEYLNRGDPEKALEQFRELMRMNPDYVAAYYHGGQALEKLGRVEEAREVYG